MERNMLHRTTARRERRAAIRRRRILCSNEQSKLCPCPTKSLLSDKDQLARPNWGERIFNDGNLNDENFLKKNLLLPVPKDEIDTNSALDYSDNNYGYTN